MKTFWRGTSTTLLLSAAASLFLGLVVGVLAGIRESVAEGVVTGIILALVSFVLFGTILSAEERLARDTSSWYSRFQQLAERKPWMHARLAGVVVALVVLLIELIRGRSWGASSLIAGAVGVVILLGRGLLNAVRSRERERGENAP